LLIFPFPVLKPGASEEYLNYIFTNKWKDVEKEINEIKEKLDGFENRLKVLESDYPKIRELLDKMSQINTDINLVKNDIEFLMKEVKELKDKFDLLEKEVGKLKLSQQVQGVFAIADSNKFAEGSLYSYSNVRVKNGRLMIRVENSYYQIVETGGFGNSANKGMNELRKRGKHYNFEAYYALGLASIVAEAARLGKAINEDDADVILKVASSAVVLTIHQQVKHILEALEPLRDKAPQQYLEILFRVSRIELNKDTARFIYDELNYILSNFFNRLSELVWPLMTAVRVCSVILSKYYIYFTKEEVEDIVESMCISLNELKKEDNELATIAEANALIPALRHPKLRNSISEYCSVKDLVTRAVKVRKSLRELANNPDKLLKNKHFIDWATSVLWISQQNIKGLITNIETHLMSSLAEYKLDSGELDEASKLFDEAAEAYKSIGDWYNYITARD